MARERISFIRCTETVDGRKVVEPVRAFMEYISVNVGVDDQVTLTATVTWESYRDKFGFSDYDTSDFTFQMSLDEMIKTGKGASDEELAERLIRQRYPSIMLMKATIRRLSNEYKS